MPASHKRIELSIATSFNYEIPIETQIPMIAEAGFTHISLGAREHHADHLSGAGRARLKRLLGHHGLDVDTIHGPRADQPDSQQTLVAAAEAAADLEAAVVVIHPGPFNFDVAELEVRLSKLIQLGSVLDGVAERMEIRFAFENVLPGPATDLTCRLLPYLDPARFGFCYDSSHDQIGGPRPLTLLVGLRDRLIAVQLSDRIREFVDHVIPGEGFIDWPAVTSALRASTFRGPLLLEVSMTHSAEHNPSRFLRLAYDRGTMLHRSVYGEAAEAGELS